jgi:alpha-galactosidase
MEALGDFLHAKGLKLGIYSDAGGKTCAKRPGSLGFEEKDAEQYANWGVDYVKYDWCNTEGLKAEEAYTKMRDALRKTQRPMVFSICEWGTSQPWTWATSVGNSWRTTGDIGACWVKGGCAKTWESGIMNILDLQVGLEAYAGPGHWNDPDMLQVGNGLTDVEDRSHFSLWALLAAPLLAGNDITTMSNATKEILLNREVIAVNQDPLGVQGSKVRDDGAEEVWAKPLQGGAKAVILLNRGTAPVRIKVRTSDLGWPSGPVSVRDLWQKKDLGGFSDGYFAEVPSHGVAMVRITRGAPAAVVTDAAKKKKN